MRQSGDMQTAELIKLLNEHKIFVFLDDGRLKTRSVKKTIEPELGQLIRQNKDALIEFLEKDETSDSNPADPAKKITRRPLADAPAPLSYGQRALWFIDQLEGSSQYHIPAVLTARGALNLGSLQYALDTIVGRHQILRTTYREVDGECQQFVSPAVPVVVKELSVADIEPNKRDDRLNEIVHNEIHQPFKLSLDMLLRVCVVHIESDYCLIVLTMHHIASDGWSSGLLVQEFRSLYLAHSQGVDSTLDELALQYADFADWQQRWLDGPALAQQVEYWRQQLEGIPSVHNFPIDYQRPSRQQYKGGVHSLTLPADVTKRVTEFAKKNDATLFMVMQSVFSLLLARWSHSNEVVVGVPVAGRGQKELERLIGFFINTVILRTDASGNPGFNDYLAKSKEVVLDAFAHQDVPLELLIDELKPPRDLSHNPLCQTKFVLQNHASEVLALPGLELEAYEHSEKQLRFDLDLTVVQRDDELVCNWSYQVSLFKQETIEFLAEMYSKLLQAAVAQPDTPIWHLPLLGRTDEEAVLEFGQSKWQALGPEDGLLQRFEQQVKLTPDAVAVRDPKQSLTFQELSIKAKRLAAFLQDQGIAKGEHVGLLMQPECALIVGLLGILSSGAVYIPLPALLGTRRLQAIIDDSKLEFMLADSALPSELSLAGVDLLSMEEACDTEWLADYHSADARPFSGVTGGDAAYLIYTSGSTGRPKGVKISHENLADYLRCASDTYYQDLDGSVLVTSYGFDISVPALYLPLVHGGCVDLNDASPIPGLVERLISDTAQKQLIRMTPMHVQGFLDLLDDAPAMPHGHVFVIGGEVFTPLLCRRLRDKFPNAAIYNHYGPSETTVGSTLYHVVDEDLERSARLPIGRPFTNTAAYVVDRQGGLAPVGIPGELYVGGRGVAMGYFAREQLSAEKFVSNPFDDSHAPKLYRTGDLVCWRRSGDLEFVGRTDDQIKIRGYRIEPGEIEAQLMANDATTQAIVIARGEGDQRKLLGYVTCSATTDARELGQQLIDDLRDKLPEYMVPAVVQVLDSFPLSANGKVDRKRLPDPEWDRLAERIAPATVTERQVAVIWSDILNQEEVGVTANFFEIGGNSLLATRIVSAVAKGLNKSITLQALFEAPTIRAFSELIDKASPNAEASLPTADRSKLLPLSFSQQRLWFIDHLQGSSSQYNMSTTLRLEGRLNRSALQKALNELVERHEILRTNYYEHDGIGCQSIRPAAPVKITHVELASDANARDKAREIAARESARPFDLENDSMLRVTLANVAANSAVLIFTMHHIASDGWSRGIIVNEFSRLYTAHDQGDPIDLRALPIQYADYALWQQQSFSSDAMESGVAYWRNQLADIPQLHSFPLDFTRPAEQDFAASSRVHHLDESLVTGLRDLANQQECSLFMVLQTAFSLLIGRWSHAEDVVMGSPVAGRVRQELEPLIGLFVNTLVLRTDLSDDVDFLTLLSRSKRTILDAFTYQDVPFERLVDEIQPARSLSHSPLFQIMFSLRNQEKSELKLPDLFIQPMETGHSTLKFDLELIATEAENGIDLTWLYASSLFTAETIGKLAVSFEILLANIVNQPESTIYRLPVVNDSEFNVLAHPQIIAPYSKDATLTSLVNQQIRNNPGSTAVASNDRVMSYDELDQRALALARLLQNQGVAAGSRVAVDVDSSMEAVVAFLAIVRSRAAYVPVDKSYPEERRRAIFDDCKPAAMVCSPIHRGGEPIEVAHLGFPRIEIDLALPLTVFEEAQKDQSQPDDLAYIMYTSGSTGTPKGVMVSHRNVVRLVEKTNFVTIESSDVFGQVSNLAFDAATFEIWGALVNGASLFVIDKPTMLEPELFAASLHKNRVSTMFLTAALFKQMADIIPNAFSNMKHLIVGGDVVDYRSVNRVLEHGAPERMSNGYGPTENTTFSTVYEMPMEPQNHCPIGQAINGSNCWVLDCGGGVVAPGGVGELVVGGDGVSLGYLGREELTKEKFIEVPFGDTQAGRAYRTGDLVRQRSDGNLEFMGRIDHQVKIRGFRIEPGEVTSALLDLDDVDTALVVVNADLPGKRLVAYVSPAQADDQSTFVARLTQQLKKRLPDYMLPREWVVLDEFPLNANGKIDRNALPAPDVAESNAHRRDAENETEATLLELWCDLLQRNDLGFDDNFFEVGGDSILAIQIVSRAKQAGISLTTRDLFENQTVRELSQCATSTNKVIASQLPSDGEQALLPIQLHYLAEDAVDIHHFNQTVLLVTPPEFDRSVVTKVIQAIYQRHDALRLAFLRDDLNAPYAKYVPLTEELVESAIVTEALPKDAAELTARCAHWQSSLVLETGQLVRCVYFEAPGREGRLLLAINHLVVDGVSWRVILRDIEECWRQLKIGDSIVLDRKTSSLKEWAIAVRDYSRGESLQRAKDYYLSYQQYAPTPLPVDRHESERPAADSTQREVIELDEVTTSALLKDTAKAYQTNVEEILLSALYLALNNWTGGNSFLVALESHGREPLFENMDVTETVGWFTTLFPLLLNSGSTTPGAVLKSIKESRRSIPNNGFDYGVLNELVGVSDLEACRPRIVFNYLGQFDQTVNQHSAFKIAPESSGPSASLRRKRRYDLGLRGRVAHGRLRLYVEYSDRHFDQATMSSLAQVLSDSLHAVIEHCVSAEVTTLTASDLTLGSVNQNQLEELQNRYADIQDVYPATPMQEGMYYHSLGNPGAYVTHAFPVLRGELNVDGFKKAWQTLVERHDIFRTALVTMGDDLHQLVVKAAELPWTELDWSTCSADEQSELLAQLRADDMSQGFDFSQPLLMRMYLASLGGDRYQLLWSHHHALLDGWSVPVVYREVIALYHQHCDGVDASLGRAPSYKKYIKWLTQQDRSKARDYWRSYLDDAWCPTLLASDRAIGRPDLTETLVARVNDSTREFRLDAQQTETLRSFAQGLGVTMNALLQVAWAYVLGRYGNQNDIVFGTVVSGRSPDVDHIEHMLGLMINAVPVRIRLEGTLRLDELLKAVHNSSLESSNHSYLSLSEITGLAGIPGGATLFDSLVVFENYPRSTFDGSGDTTPALTLEQSGSKSFSNYALTLVASAREELRLRCEYNATRFTDQSIERLLSTVADVLRDMPKIGKGTVNALRLIDDPTDRSVSVESSSTGSDDDDESIWLRIQERALHSPEAIAYSDGSVQHSYPSLVSQAQSMAERLAAVGVKAGSRVCVQGEGSIDALITMVAIWRLGGVFVPLATDWSTEFVEDVIRDCDASLALRLTHSEATYTGCPTFTLQALADVDQNESSIAAAICMQPDAVAYLGYIDAPAGSLRASSVSYANLLTLTDPAKGLGVHHQTAIAQRALLHESAAMLEHVVALATGAQLVSIDPNLDGDQLVAELVRRNVTLLCADAGLINSFPERAIHELCQLETVLAVGEGVAHRPLRALLSLERAPEVYCVLGNCATNLLGAVASVPVSEAHRPQLKQVCSKHRNIVLDSHYRSVPTGGVGALFSTCDPGVCHSSNRTLDHNTQAQADLDEQAGSYSSRVHAHGIDVQRQENDELIVLGQSNARTVSQGVVVRFSDIEREIQSLEGVLSVAVVEHIVSERTHCIAYVQIDDAFTAPNEVAVNEHLQQMLVSKRLPDHIMPAELIVVDTWPLNARHEVNADLLPTPASLVAEAAVAPRTETEQVLANIWCKLLEIDEISVTANVFELGGHSLIAIRVLSAISEHFSCAITIKEVFDYNTIERLADYIDLASGTVENANDSPVAVEKDQASLETVEW